MKMFLQILAVLLAGLRADSLAAAAAPAPNPPSIPQPPTPLRPPPDSKAFASLSFEQRRSLLYLYARLSQAEEAETLAQTILAENPADKQTLLTLASMYLDRKDSAGTRRVARALLDHYPDDHQAKYFEAAALLLEKKAPEAKQALDAIRREHFPNQHFPYQTDLAFAAIGSGEWRDAVAACQEVLRNHEISESLQSSIRSSLERLYREHLPRFSVGTLGALLDSGRAFRTSADYSQHVAQDHKILVRYHRFDTDIESARGLASQSALSQEAAVGIESAFARDWRGVAWVGGGDAGAIGLASITRAFGPRQEWTLEFKGNSHATDSLLLEALDGREHRLTVRGTFPVGRHWIATTEANLREVRIDGASLGEGGGAAWSLSRPLRRESPELHAGYRGAWMTFSNRPDNQHLADPVLAPGISSTLRDLLLDNLVLEEFHREGIYLVWRDQLIEALHYHVTTTVEYAFEIDSLVYGASAGFRFYPRRSIELAAEGGYTSNSATTALNSQEWRFNLGLKCWF